MPSSIISPFPVFNDLDGSPLENGYIYIGQSNLNPETAPVNVFWDAARTIPAAQPIRTIGGFPSRNGSPSNVYVEADTYSITVRNSRRVFVYSAFDQSDAPSSVFDISTQVITATAGQTTFTLTTFTYLPGTDTLQVYRNGLRLTSVTDYIETNSSTVTLTTPAALGDQFLFQGGAVITGNQTPGTAVSFIQAGTGAVTRNMQDKAREIVSVLDFGAVGDGVADDGPAIQAAIDSLGTLGGTVFIPSNVRCYIQSNVILKQKCSLVGTSDNLPGDLSIVTSRGSSLILNQSASIVMQGRSTRVEGLNIHIQGLPSTGMSAAQIIATSLGDAIQVENTDCCVTKCTIIGFYNAIKNYAPYIANRLFVSDVFIDCRNGITSRSSGDVTRIENVHCWPIMAEGFSDSWLNVRTGLIAFNFNTFQDWTKLTNCFCFGYETGFMLEGAATMELIGCQSDYPPATPAGNAGPTPSRVQTPNGSSGISISGASNTISIIGCVTAGSDVGIKINTTSGAGSIQIDGSHGNTHLVAGIENISGYVTANNYTARTGVLSQGTGVQTRATASRTKISDSLFTSLQYGIKQDSSLTPLFITNPTYIIANVADRVVNGYIATIPSATVIQLDGESTAFIVSGNININDIFGDADTYTGKVVVFKFTGTLTVFDATTTLRLNGNLNATPGTTLTLISDGSLWYEMARSIN